MKVFVLCLLLYISAYNCMKMIRRSHGIASEDTLDDGELGDFQKLLSKFNMLSEKTQSNLNKYKLIQHDLIPRMRFTETSTKDTQDDPDTSVADIKFPDDSTSFLSGSGVKDQELKRIEGLSNGLILYNNRRTVNSETSDFSHLYFDLLES